MPFLLETRTQWVVLSGQRCILQLWRFRHNVPLKGFRPPAKRNRLNVSSPLYLSFQNIAGQRNLAFKWKTKSSLTKQYFNMVNQSPSCNNLTRTEAMIFSVLLKHSDKKYCQQIIFKEFCVH